MTVTNEQEQVVCDFLRKPTFEFVAPDGMLNVETKAYECDFYRAIAPSTSCLFCEHCDDVFWDYSNGPYMFICDACADTSAGAMGSCGAFVEEES